MSMCVLANTLNMQSALLFSIKPMPPMSAASWKTISAPCAVFMQLSLSFKSNEKVLYPGRRLVPLVDRLNIYGADDICSICEQALHQMSADKNTGAAYHNFGFFNLHFCLING